MTSQRLVAREWGLRDETWRYLLLDEGGVQIPTPIAHDEHNAVVRGFRRLEAQNEATAEKLVMAESTLTKVGQQLGAQCARVATLAEALRKIIECHDKDPGLTWQDIADRMERYAREGLDAALGISVAEEIGT